MIDPGAYYEDNVVFTEDYEEEEKDKTKKPKEK
jgi:hypothetical protein